MADSVPGLTFQPNFSLMSSAEAQPARVAIVGAGLVGALNAIYFARRGWHVDLFELRPGALLSRSLFTPHTHTKCTTPP